jgi:hypothetical protein
MLNPTAIYHTQSPFKYLWETAGQLLHFTPRGRKYTEVLDVFITKLHVEESLHGHGWSAILRQLLNNRIYSPVIYEKVRKLHESITTLQRARTLLPGLLLV